MNVSHTEGKENRQPGKNIECKASLNFRLERSVADARVADCKNRVADAFDISKKMVDDFIVECLNESPYYVENQCFAKIAQINRGDR